MNIQNTESVNQHTQNIDTCSTRQILELINEEDQKVPGVVRKAIPDIEQAVEAVVKSLGGTGRLIYLGAGTSGRIGVIDAVECKPTFGIKPEKIPAVIAGGIQAMLRAQEQIEDQAETGIQEIIKLDVKPEDTVVGLSASGNTPFVKGALAEARKRDATTVAIICNDTGTVLQEADVKIRLDTGPEVICGSTRMKAASAQKLAVNMISTAAMIRLGKVIGNFMVEIEPKNIKLRHRACFIVKELCGIPENKAKTLLEANNWHLRETIEDNRYALHPKP